MVTISKELFVNSLNKIQEGLDKRHEFDDLMEKFSDSYYVSTLGEEWLTVATELLCNAVGDKDEGHGTMIDWFLYEDVDKKIFLSPNSKYNQTNKEIEIDVSTPELLYDYFVKYGDTQ